MDTLKTLLTSSPTLVTLDFLPGARLIILAVDASLTGWGAVLMQIGRHDGERHPVRYESGHWSQVEASYDATKRECRGVLKALKKCRGWLYGVKFLLETDANVLVAQLNRAASDLPGSLLMRWIA
jgi:ribonuclease HI